MWPTPWEWKLREGGWTKRETKEMLSACAKEKQTSLDASGLTSCVRSLGWVLLQAGLSQEDVAYSLGDSKINPKSYRRSETSKDQ